MLSRWNAKADAVSTMILWIGSVLAAIICIIWLVQNLSPDHITLQEIDNELTKLQTEMNKACRMTKYWRNYEPKISQGNLIINDIQVCIDSSPCKVVYFNMPAMEPEFIDGDIRIKQARNCSSVESCGKFYYDSENRAVKNGTEFYIVNSTTCENEIDPIIRCRLLTCSMQTREIIEFDKITFINITKDENDTITFQPE